MTRGRRIWIGLLLAGTLLVLAACGGGAKQPEPQPNPVAGAGGSQPAPDAGSGGENEQVSSEEPPTDGELDPGDTEESDPPAAPESAEAAPHPEPDDPPPAGNDGAQPKSPPPQLVRDSDFPRACLPDGWLYPEDAMMHVHATSIVSGTQSCNVPTVVFFPSDPKTMRPFYLEALAAAAWEVTGDLGAEQAEAGKAELTAVRGTESVKIEIQRALSASTFLGIDWSDSDQAKAQAVLRENRAIQSSRVTDPKLGPNDHELVTCMPHAALTPLGTQLIHAESRDQQLDCILQLSIAASPERVLEYYQFSLPAEYYPLIWLETVRDDAHIIKETELRFGGTGRLQVKLERRHRPGDVELQTAIEFRLEQGR